MIDRRPLDGQTLPAHDLPFEVLKALKRLKTKK